MALIVFGPFLRICKMVTAAPTITTVFRVKEKKVREEKVSIRYICFLLLRKHKVSEKLSENSFGFHWFI